MIVIGPFALLLLDPNGEDPPISSTSTARNALMAGKAAFFLKFI